MGRSFGGGGGGGSFGGGGGRSFGGGGGRSFGGGGGRSGGSFGSGCSGASRPPSGGYSPWGFGRTRTVFIPVGRGGGGGGSHPNGNNGSSKQSGNGCGCFSTLLILLVLLAVAVMLTNGNNGVSSSTVQREPLPAGSVAETGYYTDTLGWITNASELTRGMRQFYEETGVQPHLYLFDNVNGNYHPTADDVEPFAYALYDELFEDEAHLLVLFWEYDGQHRVWYLTGTQAKSVVDDEAADILLDYIDRYYYDQSLDEETFFSKAFADTGERIMKVTVSPLVYLGAGALALVLLALLFAWWNRAKEAKRKKDEETRRILETPLESFGDTETEKVAKKYEQADADASDTSAQSQPASDEQANSRDDTPPTT